jgi:hypothetical protein
MNKNVLLVELMQEDVKIPVQAQYDNAGRQVAYVTELTGVRIFRSINQRHEIVSQYDGKTNKCYEDVQVFNDYVGGRVIAVSSPLNKEDVHHWVVTTLNHIDDETQRLAFSGFRRATELESAQFNKLFPEFLEKTIELSARNVSF